MRKLHGSFICMAYFFGKLFIGICTTRHWQTSGRLVHEFNVCTVLFPFILFSRIPPVSQPPSDIPPPIASPHPVQPTVAPPVFPSSAYSGMVFPQAAATPEEDDDYDS